VPSNFPSQIDAFVDPSAGQPLTGPSQSQTVAKIHDAVKKVETKVGADNSADSNSHDKKIRDLQTDVTAKQNQSEKGQANGYASLDSGGKVPFVQLPSSLMEYKGTWNASTNSPALADGSGNIGDVYRITVAGTQNLGSGAITFDVGDYVILNSSLVWEKSDTTDAVSSLQGTTNQITVSSSVGNITISLPSTVSLDTILERILNSGVTIDGVLLKDGCVRIQNMQSLNWVNGPLLANDQGADTLTMETSGGFPRWIASASFFKHLTPVQADTINETTNNAGVTIDSVLLKDGGVIGLIALNRDDGTQILYKPSADTDAARGTALLSARAALAAKDTLRLGPGVYDLGSSAFSTGLPDDVSIIGSGWTTKITTTHSAGVILKPGNRNYFKDFWLEASLTDGTFQFPFGSTSGSFSNVVLDSVKITGDSDGIYLNSSSECSLKIINCHIQTMFDAIRHLNAAHTTDVYNSYLATVGDSFCDGALDRGIAAATGTINIYGGYIESHGDGGVSDYYDVFADGGTINLYGTRLYQSGVGYNIYCGTGTVNAYDTTGTGTNGLLTFTGTPNIYYGGFSYDGTNLTSGAKIISRIKRRVGTTTSSATPTINTDNVDKYVLSAQAVNITSFTTNLSGTPDEGDLLWISIVPTGTRSITYGSSFENSTVSAPTSVNTTTDILFRWNTATNKWRCISVV
jgi:hypothetical protein